MEEKKRAWNLEPEGETEMPETRVAANGVEGRNVDLNGEGHQERGQVKNHRSQSDVSGEECEEIESPKSTYVG